MATKKKTTKKKTIKIALTPTESKTLKGLVRKVEKAKTTAMFNTIGSTVEDFDLVDNIRR